MQEIVPRASDPILPIGGLSCVGTTSPRTKIQFTTRDGGIRPVDAIGRPIGDVCADHTERLGERARAKGPAARCVVERIYTMKPATAAALVHILVAKTTLAVVIFSVGSIQVSWRCWISKGN
jgi:hypothetical protein